MIKNKIAHFPDRRLFEAHFRDLSDAELLACLISPKRSEGRALEKAETILECFGSLRSAIEASPEELARCGLSPARIQMLRAAAEFSTRLLQDTLEPGQAFGCSQDVYRHFAPRLHFLKKELFWTLLLDGKNRILKIVRISEGSLTASLVHPREVFRPAVREPAAGVLFIHNHPSGDPSPSQEDRDITCRLVQCGKLLGIRVLDHIVLSEQTYFSFADQGLI